MINVCDLVKIYSGHRVLDSVNLKVSPQEMVGIMGPSGCGKSTLLRCIQGLTAYDEGVVTVQGRTGFMFQNFNLFPHLTVMENLLCAVYNKREEYETAAMEILEQLELQSKADVYPRMLSGGQQQRVSLARALVLQPDILLCDEPTSGLDKKTAEGVSELFKGLKAQGKTVLIAAHDQTFLNNTVDRIVRCRKGKFLDSDPAS